MITISDLPVEILLHIFQYYMEIEKQENLMEVIAEVCVDWRNACLSSSLWTKYDGSLHFDRLLDLSKSGCLSNTKKLILSRIDNLKDVVEDELFSGVKNLEVIDFSNVRQLSKNTLSVVASNCSKLREIDIGGKELHTRLNYEMLGGFFAAVGGGLVKINLSHCRIASFQLSLRCISDCCSNLEYLYLMNISCTNGAFPTKYFQMHCPKLKALYLDQNIRIMINKHPSGFPNLEIFAYTDSGGGAINDKEFKCIVFNSPKLNFLSLTNCDISASVLCSLPASSVECLYIARSKVCHMNALSDVLKKWSHSLKEVDVSYGNNYAINKGIFCLVTTPLQSPLEVLNLNFTKIIAVMVEEVLRNCTNLDVLQLQGCRNLGRGMKKNYCGKYELGDLSTKLKAFKSAHPELVETIDLY